MARLRVKRPTRRSLGISVLLLFIFIQVVTSLVVFAGVFILSNNFLISPLHSCPTHEYSQLFCHKLNLFSEAESQIEIITKTVIIISLYSPVVLVAFALLAMLFVVYTKDRAVLWLSMACQAASSILILTGITVFLLLNQSYVSWGGLTICFYVCVAVPFELIITTVLTCVSGRRACDWE